LILSNFQETEEINYGKYLIRTIHNISTYTNLVFAPHWHKYCEMLLVHSGKINITTNDITYQLTNGDFIFFNDSELHTGLTQQECNYHAIQFKWEDILSASEKEKLLLQRLKDGYYKFKTPTNDPHIQKLFNNIIELCETDKRTRPFEERKAISELLIYLFENYLVKNNLSVNKSKNDDFTENVTTYIHNNFLTISPKDVADHFSFNQSYFNRKFKTHMLITPSEYINLCKIEHSQKLLLQTNNNLSEIATLSGFNSLSFYSVTFKKLIGMSPLDWKAQYR